LTVDGEGGSDTLNLIDDGMPLPITYTVSSTTVNASGRTYTYSNVETFSLETSSTADNPINVESTDAGTAWTIKAGTGNASFALGQAGSLDTILGPVTLTAGGGTDSLTINDGADGSGNVYAVSPTGVVRNGAQIVTYDSTFESVSILAGGGNDTATLTPSTTASMSFQGGAHAIGDTLNVNGTGVTTPSMTGTPANGQITFGNRQPASFQQVESLLFNGSPAGGVFSVASTTVNEAAGPATITVNRTGNKLGAAPVDYTTSNGTAFAGQEYMTASGTLTFADGEATRTFSVPLIDDLTIEPDKTVLLTLTNAGGAAVLANPATGTLTIADDDLPTPTPTVTPTPTGTSTLTSTSTPTSTPTATVTPTATGTSILISAATSTPTATVTLTLLPTTTTAPQDENKDDSRKPLTEEQRQQHQLTNRSNRDDTYTEGSVVEVATDTQGPYLVIANRDGLVVIRLRCGSGCPTVRPGDYVEVDGVKENEQLFYADEVTVSGR
jgi:hypothetical protein